jgi:hypothetical protein
MNQSTSQSRRHPIGPKPIFLVTLLLACVPFVSQTQISIPGVDIPLTQDFNTMAATGGASSVMPANWVFLETGGNATYTVDNGANATNDTYSYGTGSAVDRSLGQLNGGTITSINMGVPFVNNTGVTITSLLIQYIGEQWRLGATARVDRLDFQYSTNATAINNGSWTDFDGLDFTAPVTAGVVGALDGNATANRTHLAKIITGLSIANGATVWIRWNSFDAAGNDDGLGIDDFALTANPPASPHYTVSNSGVTLSITDAIGNGEEIEVSQVGTNIRFFVSGRTYSLNAGATTALPIDVAIAGLSFIVINAQAGSDTINVAAFSTNLPGFTINGGTDNDVVNMNGDINFQSGSQFNADLQNDNATPGSDKIILAANANLICSGTGIATVKASQSIVINSGASIVTANGNMVIEANTLATATTGNFVGLSVTGLLQVTGTGSATITAKGGTTGAGNIGINISSGGDIIGGTSGALTITGNGGISAGNGHSGINVTSSGSTISSGGANVIINGVAGGSGTSASNHGVFCGNSGMITAGGTGSVTINGTGGACTGGTNIGVWVGSNGTITSGGGVVNVTGNGGGASGSGTFNYGVYVQGGGKITAGSSGVVTVNGTGGLSTGSPNDGISIWGANSMITSSGGDVNVTGQGGGITTSGSNVGVHLQTLATISAGGTGDVVVTGTGGTTTGVNNFGIFVIENGTSITSSGGNVTLVGVGGGSGSSSGNNGIVVYQGMVTAGGTGTVSLTGTGGTASGTGNTGIRISESTGIVTSGGGSIILTGIEGTAADAYAIQIHNSSTVTTAINGGNISLIGNSINIAAAVVANSSNSVAIRQYTNAVDMNLGPATDPIGGPLNLTDAELDFVTANTLLLGEGTTTGTFTISSPITRTAMIGIGMYSSEDVIINGGSMNSNNGIIVFDAGVSPFAVRALQAGVDATGGPVYPIGDLLINIDGTVADVSYTQLNVAGTINLSLASLKFSGTYDPLPGDVFTIVLNDGADFITGTFTGLPQGGTIVNFMGSGLPATITYIGGTGNDVVITVGAPDYIISNAAGLLSITDFAGNGETLTVAGNGPNINFNVTPTQRTYSLNGGAVTNFPIDIAIAGLTSITVDAAVGSDVINVAVFATSLPSMTINGGIGDETVNFTGDITFIANASLNVDLQNDDPSPGVDLVAMTSGTNLTLTGTGSATIRVSRSITLASSASITTVNGALIAEANQQATPTTGTFSGVSLASSSLLQASGTGIVTVKGKGGTTSGNQNGINIVSGDIIGGTTGTMIIQGTGGVTTGNTNTGVTVSGAGASITSLGGNVSVTGTGGGSASAVVNIGVNVGSGGIITAGGSGTVSVTGTGGVTSGTGNEGIRVDGVASMITSNGGSVNVVGTGGGTGSASVAHGIAINTSGLISAGGSATLTVNGTGGPGTGGSNFGIYLSASTTKITGTAGTLTVLGQGGGTGTSSSNVGVNNSGTISSAGTGPVFVQGWGGLGSGGNQWGVSVGAGGLITSSGGLVQVVGSGGLLATSSNNYGVTVLSSGKIRSSGAGNTTVIGTGGGTGATQLNNGVNVSLAGEISAAGTGNVSVHGTGGFGSVGTNIGVYVVDNNSLITSSGGTVTVTGIGGGVGSSANNYGVLLTSQGTITSGGTGVVTVNGTGGFTTGFNNHGIAASVSGGTITSSGGNVFVTGQGGGTGTSGANIGVDAQQGGIISAGGAGQVTINGTGGNASGNSNYGVLVWLNGSTITSAGGNVIVNGEGGSSGSSASSSHGVYVLNGKITAGGSGTVSIYGAGSSASGSNNNGFRIGGSTGVVTSSGGAVLIVGEAGGSATSYGIVLDDDAEINTEMNGGSIHLKSNSIFIDALVRTDPAYFTWLDPFTNGTDINLGTAGDFITGPLQLTDQELDSISTGYLLIGSSTTGDITTTADITRTSATIVSLQSADNVFIDDGLINTNGGDLTITTGASPDAMYPLKAGSDVICNTFYPIGPVQITITGLVADVDYTQFNVTGTVNLEDASLLTSGSLVTQAGQQFIIINNDGADPILNTFVGLPEGATIASFLGGAYPATISYVGGSGNDVVITVASPNYLLSTTGNQIVFTDVAGNGETIIVSQPSQNNIQFSVAGRNYSMNGGAVTALPVVTSLVGMTTVTVNAGGGNDGILIGPFNPGLCNLTLNGGIGNDIVTMNGDITFAANSNLNIDLQNDDPVPGDDQISVITNINLVLSGTGTATLKASRNISFSNGSSLTTVNGNLTIEANQQATPTTGTFYGVVMTDNSLVEVTGSGTLDVKGKGGTTSNAQIGVYLYNSAILRGGPSGNHVVTGTGGATTSNDNRGIQVQLSAMITTNGGNLILNAQGGGTGASAHNHGIHIVQAGVVTAGGLGTVTINSYGGTPTGIRNHGIHVYGAGSVVTSGGGNVYVYGQSGGSGASSYNHGVFVELFGMITAGGMGTVTVEGVGGTPEGIRNDGVICFQQGATITSSGGDVHVTGTGGGSGASAYNYGVFSDFGGEFTAGGMGDLYVTGTGGATTGTRNTGVHVYQQNAYITTSGGDLYITGQGGGAGASTENFGVHILNGGKVIAGGEGSVFVTGTGGTTTGTRNDGVCIEVDTAIITSSGGDVEVIGFGAGTGDAFRDYGVFVNSTGVISAGGTGNVNVEGTGSPTSGGVRNYGVAIAVAGSMITSSGGSINVIGQGGGTGPASNNNFGTYLTSGSILAPGNGTINIEGTGGNAEGPYNFGVYTVGAPSMIATANGDINVYGQGAGTGTAAIYLYGVRFDAHVFAGGNGNIFVEGYGGNNNSINNWGLVLEGPEADITTANGNITAFGQGGNTGSSNSQLGVYLSAGAQIVTGGAGITTVEGIGGNSTGSSNFGVYMQSAGTLISSGGGDVNVTGQGGGNGGTGSTNYGIDVVNGAVISAGSGGDVTLNGTGGESTSGSNFGIVVYNPGAAVTSTDGDIHIIGQGGGSGSGTGNLGFYLQNQAFIAAGGFGNIVIEGTGGNTNGAFNYGTLFWQPGTSVTSNDGDISIIGIGDGGGNSTWGLGVYVLDALIAAGGTGDITLHGTGSTNVGLTNHGVYIVGVAAEVSTADGDISVTGIPGGGADQLGILHSGGAQMHTSTGGGNIELLSNSMAIFSGIETLPADTVFISSLSVDTSITLGANGDMGSGPLMLSDVELDSITTGTLMIGSNTAGTITVIDSITRTLSTVVNLTSGIDVIFDGGMLNTNGGNSTLDPGASPDAVRPYQLGTDVACSDLTLAGPLAIRINGTTPDTLYDQLTVNGTVDLNGVSLLLSGIHIPVFFDTFLIVLNDGVDPIVGTFSGLPQGGSIPSFLGSNLTATISYTGGDGNDVILYLTAPDYLLTNIGGHLVVTDLSGNGDVMTISENGANIRFTVPGRTYSYNFSSIANLPVDVPMAGIDSLTVNGEEGHDNFTINSFIEDFPAFTLNGGTGNESVTFAGDLTFQVNASLDVDLQNDDVVPGTDNIIVNANVDLIFTDTADFTFKASRDIVFNTGSYIQLEDGNVTIEANYQLVPTLLNFHGVTFTNSTLSATGTGSMIIKGKAGQTNIGNHGVRIEGGSDIIGGSTNDVIIEGRGAQSVSQACLGVFVTGAGSTVTSTGADVHVTGFGGGVNSSSQSNGVEVTAGAIITAGGSGDVFVTGFGGNGSFNNMGVRVFNAGSFITSTGGNVTVIGNGTSNPVSSQGIGVFVSSGGKITATGEGEVSVTGTGGVGSGTGNYGIWVNGVNASISTEDGNITLQGAGGGSAPSGTNYGVSISSNGSVSAGGDGEVSIQGTGGVGQLGHCFGFDMSTTSSVITANGDVTIVGQAGGSAAGENNYGVHVQNGASIISGGIGTTTVTGTGGNTTGQRNFGVYVRTANALISSSGGNVMVTGQGGGQGTSLINTGVYIELNGKISAGGMGEVHVTGTGGATTGGANHGIYVSQAPAGITSSGGDVHITGFGGNDAVTNSGNGVYIVNASTILPGGMGDLFIEGTGSNGEFNGNSGVQCQQAGTLITSNGGNVTILGHGGGDANVFTNLNSGVTINFGGTISAGGNGTLSVTGNGGFGLGSLNNGIALSNIGTITSTNGNVNVTGTAIGSPSSGGCVGIQVLTGTITAGGTGTVTVQGTGGVGTGISQHGIFMQGVNSLIQSANGNVEVTGLAGGTGTAGGHFGVYLLNGAKIKAGGAGQTLVSGTGGPTTGVNNRGVYVEGAGSTISSTGNSVIINGIEGGGPSGTGFYNNAGGTVTTSVDGGSIFIHANSMSVNAPIQTNASNSTTLTPYTNSTRIALGTVGDVPGGPLNLTDTELDQVTTGTLIIGDVNADTISVFNDISRAALTNVELITAADVIFDGGEINTNGGDLFLDPGLSPNAVRPWTHSTDAIVETVSFGSDLAIRINGTTVDTQYDQFNVNGEIDLTGVELMLSGTYTPMSSDSFIIVLNDDVDPIIGTFVGLAEGDTIYNFLGDTVDAVITYMGNTGNDVVIRLPVLCAMPDAPEMAAMPDTLCAGTEVTLTITAGNLGAATEWHWYANACGGISIGTGTSIDVTPGMTTTYFARGEGGCVTSAECGEITVVVNEFPDPSIDREFSGPCYYTENVFQPEAPVIPGATYSWHFGAGAQPLTALGYGPHDVIYTTNGMKTVKLVIHPNAPGAQCPDSSLLMFSINNCPGQILGSVISTTGAPITNVNVKLFADNNTDGLPDTTVHIRSVFTPPSGQYAMATLIPGNYVIVQTQPNMWESFDDGDTSPDGDIVPNVDSLDNIIPVTILINENDSFNIFVERPDPGSINGVVFQDFDVDQQPDPGEGLPGVLVTLYADANTNGVADNSIAIDTAHTNGMGQYLMTDVPVGHYVLVETTPAGMTSIKDFDVSQDGDVVPNTNMNNDTIPVSITNDEVDAGNFFIDLLSGCALVVTNDNDAGPGSLRFMLNCAAPGDTIQFHPSLSGDTIEISSGPLELQNDVIIKSALNPTVTVRSSVNDLFIVTPGVEASIRGVHIVSGLSPAGIGAAIDNHGSMLLHNVHITRNPLLPPDEVLVRNHPMSHFEISGNCLFE